MPPKLFFSCWQMCTRYDDNDPTSASFWVAVMRFIKQFKWRKKVQIIGKEAMCFFVLGIICSGYRGVL